jgi:DNA repair exonuclease SbcCD ATPase subunit
MEAQGLFNQVIIITHVQDVIEGCDQVIRVREEPGGRSSVEMEGRLSVA